MPTPAPEAARRLKAEIERLAALAAENKRLLERGLMVQGRLVGLIAAALPKALDCAPRYGARGAFLREATMRPVALSASA